MKKFFLLFLFFGGVEIILLGQIQKGNYYVGGLLDFNVTKSHGYSVDNVKIARNLNEIEFSPGFGYFLNRKFAIGGQVSLTSFVEKYSTGDKFRENTYLFSPLIRYYIHNGLFTQFNLGLGMKNSKIAKINVFKSSIEAGYSVFLNKSVALEPIFSLIYTNESIKNRDYKLNSNIFNFSLRFNCFFNSKSLQHEK